jgi:hypothetical protein
MHIKSNGRLLNTLQMSLQSDDLYFDDTLHNFQQFHDGLNVVSVRHPLHDILSQTYRRSNSAYRCGTSNNATNYNYADTGDSNKIGKRQELPSKSSPPLSSSSSQPAKGAGEVATVCESRASPSTTSSSVPRTILNDEMTLLPERKPLSQLNTLSLPNINDRSMNHTLLFMEHYKVELLWSIISDILFIIGGISNTVLSIYDYWVYHYNATTTITTFHIAIDILSPTIYLMNSVIDIRRAESVRRRLKDKQELTKAWNDARLKFRNTSFNDITSSYCSDPYVDQDNQNDNQTLQFGNHFGNTWCHRIRKYAAHRRSLVAAYTFGIAAALAVVLAVCRNSFQNQANYNVDDIYVNYDDNTGMSWLYRSDIDTMLGVTSHQLYIISSIFSITGKRNRPWLAPSDPTTCLLDDSGRLQDLGDLLFLIGSLMDASLTIFNLKHLLLLPIISSIFWMIDGCLYMRSNFVKVTKLLDEENAIASTSDTHPNKFIL